MLSCNVFIATSLDGFIARPDGSLDWLEPFQGDGDNGYAEFIAGMDGIVMGRGTFEAVLGFGDWPYSLPVVVLSRSMTQADIPGHLRAGVELSAEEPPGLVRRLGDRGWRHAYVDGGQVVQSFLRAGLIADLALFRMPVLLGEGRPLFGPLPVDVRLETAGTFLLPTGAVRTDYRVLSEPR